MAPEMLKNQAHDKTVDIWSLGVLLYELLHGYAPFGGTSDRDKIMKITNYDFKMGEHISPNARDLISKLMKLNPKERIDFDTIFVHPWLKKFETDFKMDMGKFRYDPEKSRNRSRSRSPNVSEIKVEKPKDTGERSPLVEGRSNTFKGERSHVIKEERKDNRFEKTEADDKRGRSNSPMTSNYKSNNLGMKDVESSLNQSNISNRMNNSTMNVKIPEKTGRVENDKKNSALVSSKSYENLQQNIVQNALLTNNSRDNSIERGMGKNNDRSKSPSDRNRIFEDPRTREEKKSFDNQLKGPNEKTSFRPPKQPEKVLEKSPGATDKHSYRAAKISEVDDSILKEIEKANKLEDKLEKMLKTNKDLFSQIGPFKSPTEIRKIEVSNYFKINTFFLFQDSGTLSETRVSRTYGHP